METVLGVMPSSVRQGPISQPLDCGVMAALEGAFSRGEDRAPHGAEVLPVQLLELALLPWQRSLWEPWPCVRICARGAGLAPRAAAEEREGDGLAGGWELGAVGWEGAPGVSGWG